MSPPRDPRLFSASPANGHARYGSRGTRTASKLGVRPISGPKLERLLRAARPANTDTTKGATP